MAYGTQYEDYGAGVSPLTTASRSTSTPMAIRCWNLPYPRRTNPEPLTPNRNPNPDLNPHLQPLIPNP